MIKLKKLHDEFIIFMFFYRFRASDIIKNEKIFPKVPPKLLLEKAFKTEFC